MQQFEWPVQEEENLDGEKTHERIADGGYEYLSREESERVIEKGIETMRSVFRDAGLEENYMVFASTVLYLHGKEK